MIIPGGRKTMAAGAVLALAAGGLTVGSLLGGGDAPTPSAKASTHPGAVNVMTGKPGHAGGVLAVKIDNVVPARPATGLESADLVYVIQVEGGLSRLMAVYDSNGMPPVIGPVRSARETDLRLLAQFNRPGFAYSGARSGLLPALRSAPLINRSPSQNGSRYYRSGNRSAPHNEYLHPRGLGGAKAKDIGLRFGAAPAGGIPDPSVTANMPAARFTFTWHGGRYDVSMDGTRQPARADTVVVQDVRVGPSPRGYKGSPYSETVGFGRAAVYRDGKRYACTWNRPTAKNGTAFRFNGKIMNFHPGRTWIVLV